MRLCLHSYRMWRFDREPRGPVPCTSHPAMGNQSPSTFTESPGYRAAPSCQGTVNVWRCCGLGRGLGRRAWSALTFLSQQRATRFPHAQSVLAMPGHFWGMLGRGDGWAGRWESRFVLVLLFFFFWFSFRSRSVLVHQCRGLSCVCVCGGVCAMCGWCVLLTH